MMRSELAPATPQLPVRDVVQAQAWFADTLGFSVAWHNDGGGIGAVNHGACALFLKAASADAAPATVWIFAVQIDEAFADAVAGGAEITDPLADRPWGLRQFSLRDPDGNTLIFHHDLD